MRTATINTLTAAILLSMVAAPAMAQTWDESVHGGRDAGAMMGTAHDLSASSYSMITGSLRDSTDIDMYRIQIINPANFRATTVKQHYHFPADAADTWLYLFDENGHGVYSNQESPLGDPSNDSGGMNSLLPATSDLFANPIGLGPLSPGVYYLAVGTYPLVPLDKVGAALFEDPNDFDNDWDRITAPIGTAGALWSWTDTGAWSWGDYEVRISAAPLATELSAFDGTLDGNDVILRWTTLNETSSIGFDIEKRDHNGSYQTVGFVESRGNAGEETSYSYRVDDLSFGANVFRLSMLNSDGSVDYSPAVEAVLDVPNTYLVTEAYPNPFASAAQLSVSVQETQHVTVEMYNLLGQRVGRFFDGVIGADESRIVHIDGESLSSAQYVLKIAGDDFVSSQMISLTR